MGHKIYLSPAEQWDRSVMVAQEVPPGLMFRKELGDRLRLGRIVRPHRLFRPGDIVLVLISNGMGERQPVWAVSSKGYCVKNYYMQHSRGRRHQQDFADYSDFGPLRFVDLPGHLVGRTPDDPDVRHFVVGNLRAGDSAAR